MMQFKDKDGNVTHTLADEGLVSRIGTVSPETKLEVHQNLLRDVTTMGSAWLRDGKRINPAEVYAASSDPREMYAVPVELTQGYKLKEPLPNTIHFRMDNGQTEVLRISKDGIWANPDVHADEAAKKVIEAMDGYIKQMVERVRSEEREAIAQMFDEPMRIVPFVQNHEGGCLICGFTPSHAAAAIRARSHP